MRYWRAGLGNRLGTPQSLLWSEPLLCPLFLKFQKPGGGVVRVEVVSSCLIDSSLLGWLTPAPWLRWLSGMGTGKDLVFSTSLEVYFWIYGMDHCSVVFFPQKEIWVLLGRKKWILRCICGWIHTYPPTHIHTPTHTHTHTLSHVCIFSIKLTVSILSLN